MLPYKPFLKPLDGFLPPPPLAECLRIDPGPARAYWVISESYWPVNTHFIDGRTFPCLANDGRCPVDHSQTSVRWQAWLAVQPTGRRQALFVGLTEAAVRDCPALHEAQGRLRGRAISIGRAGESKRGRMRISLGDAQAPASQLLPPADIGAFLHHLWRGAVEALAAKQDAYRHMREAGER